jgi:DNA-binding LacI/PurR family transcriptional regulator
MARILKLVEELGYRPNASARDLHRSRGDLVGLVIPDLSYPGLNGIVNGIQTSLDQAQMQLVICPVQNMPSASGAERQKAYFDLLYNNRVEGLLLTQWSAIQSETLELAQSGRPTTILEQDLLARGLRTSIDWLEQQGCTHLFLVASTDSILEPSLTRSMFKQLTGPQGVSVDSSDDLISALSRLEMKGRNAAGVLCISDQRALEIRECLAKKDLRPLIMSMENGALARWANIPALAFDEFQLGQLAAQRLLKKLNIDGTETNRVLHTWIETDRDRGRG